MSQNEKSPQEKRVSAYAGIVFASFALLLILCGVFERVPGWLILLTCFGSIFMIISCIFVLKELNEHK